VLLARGGTNGEALNAALEALVESQRVQAQQTSDGVIYSANEIVLGFEQPSGWEGAVLDHFQALVRTICSKLSLEPTARADDATGGSTYTFVVWPDHPHYAEVTNHLRAFRSGQSELRRRVDEYNAAHGIPRRHLNVIAYAGQCVIEQDRVLNEEEPDA
jgi:hypothetical protein